MAIVNHSKKEIQFKVVYCGTPKGGKTTNLEYIHNKLDPHFRGDIVSIATPQDRTIFFDFLPVNSFEIFGYRTRFQLYTVPGQAVFEETRTRLLSGADGIIFVTDSSPERLQANLKSWNQLQVNLEENGLDRAGFPVVFQHNKRDLAEAVAPEAIDEMLSVTAPSFLGCARSGYQVFATLDCLTQIVLRQFRASNVEGFRPAKPCEDENTERKQSILAG